MLGRSVLALCILAAVLPAAAAPRHSLTREQADQIALRILTPKSYPDAVLYRDPRPLIWFKNTPPHVISQAGPLGEVADDAVDHLLGSRVFSYTVTHGVVWVYWLDLEHGFDFEHPSRLLLLDGTSGQVIMQRTLEWEPLIDRQPPAFLASDEAQTDPQYVVASSVPLERPEPERAKITTHNTLPPNFLDQDCMITIGDLSPAEDFQSDLGDFAGWAGHVGLRTFAMPANSTGADLVERVHALANGTQPCHNVVIVLAGHGAPPPGYTDPHAAASKEATVRTGYGFETGANQAPVESDYHVRASDFQRLLEQNPLTSFELIVDSCFSGRFHDLLVWEKDRKLTNLLLVASSSRADQTSVGHVAEGVVDSVSHEQVGNFLANALAIWQSKELATNPELPRQQVPESDWTHAFVDSLYQWSDTKPLGDQAPPVAFVSALDAAAQAAKANFVAASLHWTAPGSWQGPSQTTYRYHVKITVSNATIGWATPNGGPSGSGTASWELDFDNASISVSRWSRTVDARMGPWNPNGGPETAAPSAATVQASGAGSNGTASCSYDLSGTLPGLKQRGFVFGLQEIGGDEFQTKPHDAAGFVYTGALVLEPVDVLTTGNVPIQCSNDAAWSVPDNGLPGLDYVNPNGGTVPLSGTGFGCFPIKPLIAVPVWKLGDPKPITLEGTIVPGGCGGLQLRAGGTYKVVLTLQQGHRIG